jgi:serralysin
LSFATLVNSGQIVVGAGDEVAFGTVASASYTGIIDLHPGGLVDFQGAVGNQIIDFISPGGNAKIDNPGVFSATAVIVGFQPGDTIDLATLPFSGLGTATLLAGNILQVSESGSSFDLQFDPNQSFAGDRFTLSSDGATGTLIQESPARLPPQDDFTGNGISDILWEDTSGDVAIWDISNGSVVGNGIVGFAAQGWAAVGTGDFNGDGTDDILWQNLGDNAVDIWTMQNGQVASVSQIGFASTPTWQVAGTGDFSVARNRRHSRYLDDAGW